MSSRRETMLAAVKTALEGINGSPNYSITLAAAQVQRFIHHFSDREEVVNSFSTLPAAMIVAGSETSPGQDSETLGLLTCSLPVEIDLYLGADADCEDRTAALADLKRALGLALIADGFGVGAVLRGTEAPPYNADEGQSADLVRVIWTLEWLEEIGDPSSGA